MAAHTSWRRSTVRLGGISIVMALGGGSAQAQDPLPAPQTAAPLPWYQRHAVFRPALNLPTRKPLMETGYEFPTRPLFLKGYAGYNYGRGPREAFIPTGYGTGMIQPVGTAAPVPCDNGGMLRRWWRR